MKKNLTKFLVLFLYTVIYFNYSVFGDWFCKDKIKCLKDFFGNQITNLDLSFFIVFIIPFLLGFMFLLFTINSFFNKKKIAILWLLIFIVINSFAFYFFYKISHIRMSPPEPHFPCIPNTPGCE